MKTWATEEKGRITKAVGEFGKAGSVERTPISGSDE